MISLFVLLQGLAIVLSVAHASSTSDLSVPPPPAASFWRLNSRNALVTGGTKGIGAAIVTQLSSLGCVSIYLELAHQNQNIASILILANFYANSSISFRAS